MLDHMVQVHNFEGGGGRLEVIEGTQPSAIGQTEWGTGGEIGNLKITNQLLVTNRTSNSAISNGGRLPPTVHLSLSLRSSEVVQVQV